MKVKTKQIKNPRRSTATETPTDQNSPGCTVVVHLPSVVRRQESERLSAVVAAVEAVVVVEKDLHCDSELSVRSWCWRPRTGRAFSERAGCLTRGSSVEDIISD